MESHTLIPRWKIFQVLIYTCELTELRLSPISVCHCFEAHSCYNKATSDLGSATWLTPTYKDSYTLVKLILFMTFLGEMRSHTDVSVCGEGRGVRRTYTLIK